MDRLQMLKEYLDENPQDPFARYGLAIEYAKTGQTDVALQEFATLLSEHPDYTAGYQMAAQTLMQLGRSEEARNMLKAGVACAERTNNRHAMSEMQGMLDELG
jgi:predicted Zn-dependent protease